MPGLGKISEADKKRNLEDILNQSNDPEKSGQNQGVDNPRVTSRGHCRGHVA